MMDWFWSEWFWIPSAYTWDDFKSRNGSTIANPDDLLTWPFVFMAGLFIFRNCILIPFILSPIGKHYGIRSKPYSPPPANEELEKLYKVNRARPPKDLLRRYATEIEWTERRVERWLRHKALSQQMTTLEKFNEFGWQAVYYTSYFVFGLFVVATEPYFWDIRQTFEGYPQISISPKLWVYYMTTIGFYLCQMVLLFTNTRRHDFNMMFSHHVCSLILFSFCWVINCVHIMSVSILVHECVDAILATAKLFFYCGKTDISNYLSILFALVWVITRLVIYPFHVLKGSLFICASVVGGTWPIYYVLNAMNLSLLCMHVLWTKEIYTTFSTRLTTKDSTVVMDSRSSPEELLDDDQSEEDSKTK